MRPGVLRRHLGGRGQLGGASGESAVLVPAGIVGTGPFLNRVSMRVGTYQTPPVKLLPGQTLKTSPGTYTAFVDGQNPEFTPQGSLVLRSPSVALPSVTVAAGQPSPLTKLSCVSIEPAAPITFGAPTATLRLTEGPSYGHQSDVLLDASKLTDRLNDSKHVKLLVPAGPIELDVPGIVGTKKITAPENGCGKLTLKTRTFGAEVDEIDPAFPDEGFGTQAHDNVFMKVGDYLDRMQNFSFSTHLGVDRPRRHVRGHDHRAGRERPALGQEDRLVPLTRAAPRGLRCPAMIGGPRAKMRNSREMHFFVSFERCRSCHELLDPEDFRYGGDVGTGACLSGKCQNCLTPVGFSFLGDSLSKAPSGAWDEVGPGRTEVLAPSRLAGELERLGGEILDDPTPLDPAGWEVNRERNKRALLCARELAKLLDEGRAEVADELLDDHERAERAAHPAWYQRAWIESRLARHRAVVEANVKDLPRINQLEAEAAKLRPKGIDYLDRDALVAHEQWLSRKQQGKGRLVLVKAKHRRESFGRGIQLSGARFHEVDMPNVYLEDVALVSAELTKVKMVEGRLYAARLRQAVITGSSFKAADLSLAELDGARVSDTDFSRANLDLSQWPGAVVERCRFDGAVFGDANLDGVTFRGCSFRGASLAPSDPKAPPTSNGARFEDCDLRDARLEGRDLSGAVFVRCDLAGSTGAPVRTGD